MNCRVCSSTNLEEFLDLGDQPHCDSLLSSEQLSRKEPYYPLKVCFCRECTTIQITYTVPKEEMFSEYLYISGTTQTLRRHFQETSDRLVKRLSLKPGDLVVDIGSNDGTWLSSYAPHGLRTLGVDPASNLAEIANGRGIETLNRFFNAGVASEIVKKYGRPRLVTAAGVFFHLEELHSVTEGIADFCKDGGVFCVQAIYLGAMIRENQFDNIYHEHLTYWTVKSLTKLFALHGLEIFSADLLPIHGGSLELLVGLEGAHEVEVSVEKMIASEREAELDRVETYRRFGDEVWKIRDGLLAILRDFKACGKKVVAFGAPAKGATLLNSFRITTDLVSCAVERNAFKVGKYIPGARIPILDEDKVPPPDAYLILPWNFLKEFVRKKEDYLKNGGAFIVAIPKPMVIDASNYRQFL